MLPKYLREAQKLFTRTIKNGFRRKNLLGKNWCVQRRKVLANILSLKTFLTEMWGKEAMSLTREASLALLLTKKRSVIDALLLEEPAVEQRTQDRSICCGFELTTQSVASVHHRPRTPSDSRRQKLSSGSWRALTSPRACGCSPPLRCSGRWIFGSQSRGSIVGRCPGELTGQLLDEGCPVDAEVCNVGHGRGGGAEERGCAGGSCQGYANALVQFTRALADVAEAASMAMRNGP
jgi:hypothetical protein